MSYIDFFVFAVKSTDKDKFIDYARECDRIFVELGATRLVECWGDDVPIGKLTDFHRAVQAEEDETIVCGFAEWPDKATRDEAMEEMQTVMETDPRYDAQKNPPPYDGMRMIYGGFTPVFELRK